MKKLYFTLLFFYGMCASQECRAGNWFETLTNKVAWSVFSAGTGLYFLHTLWQWLAPLAKNKIEDFKAQEVAKMLFIQLKMPNECTPQERETKKKILILRTRVIEQLRKNKENLNESAQGALAFIDTVLTTLDTLSMYVEDMPAYVVSDADGRSWLDRIIQKKCIDSFVLAFKTMSESSENERIQKRDDMRLRSLVFDKLLAKIDEQPKTPLWVARKHLVKMFQNWLTQQDISESALVMKALEFVHNAYKAREQLKNLFKMNLKEQMA